MNVSPIEPRESAVSACAAAIRKAILTGELRVGARLPPERSLAVSFGVNRVTVRSALSQLAAARLLSVKQGSGYQVRDFEREGGPDLLPGLSELAETKSEVVEIAEDLLLVRRKLATAVLERLATRTTKKARASIAAAVSAFEIVVFTGLGVEEIARADVEVLGVIVEATGSRVLRLCLNPVLTVVAAMPDLCAAIYAQPESSVMGYRALLLWLEKPEVETIDGIVRELRKRDDETLGRLRKRRVGTETKREKR